MRLLLAAALPALLFALGGAARAADIVVAQVSPLSGPLASSGIANYLGAKAVFDQVNGQGGVQGRKIRFVREDDRYQPEETVRLVELVAQRDKPTLFVTLYGSANVAALLKDHTLERLRIPAFGITPGSESLRTPGSPWMFHVTAGDRAQLQHIVSHLQTIGLRRFAVVYLDNPFGSTALGFIKEMCADGKAQIVATVKVPPGAENLQAAAREMRQAGAQAYLVLLSSSTGATFVRDIRAAGDATPMYGMSYLSLPDIKAKTPLDKAVGVALAQVSPNLDSQSNAMVRDFHAVMARFAPEVKDHTQTHFRGYLAARVAVEALRHAGPSPTPESVAAAARQLRADFGAFPVEFKGGNVGVNYTDIGVIGQNGKLVY
jgi:branched-chain amino acid transport system substrate-binding protein